MWIIYSRNIKISRESATFHGGLWEHENEDIGLCKSNTISERAREGREQASAHPSQGRRFGESEKFQAHDESAVNAAKKNMLNEALRERAN